jgi:hypothetical protein
MWLWISSPSQQTVSRAESIPAQLCARTGCLEVVAGLENFESNSSVGIPPTSQTATTPQILDQRLLKLCPAVGLAAKPLLWSFSAWNAFCPMILCFMLRFDKYCLTWGCQTIRLLSVTITPG